MVRGEASDDGANARPAWGLCTCAARLIKAHSAPHAVLNTSTPPTPSRHPRTSLHYFDSEGATYVKCCMLSFDVEMTSDTSLQLNFKVGVILHTIVYKAAAVFVADALCKLLT